MRTVTFAFKSLIKTDENIMATPGGFRAYFMVCGTDSVQCRISTAKIPRAPVKTMTVFEK